jgi:mono/diheme cytochrome c family protein
VRVLTAALLLVGSALGAQEPLTPFQSQKARTLIRTQLPCLGCHELDGEGGRIAPSLNTVGERRSVRYIRSMIENPQGTLRGVAMPRHVMAPQVRDLVVRFLSSGARGSDTPALEPQPVAAGTPSGIHLYAKWCASCHGVSGKGDGVNAAALPVKPANHADAVAMSKRPDDSLFDVIAVGGLPYGRSPRMPAFAGTLSTAEMRALVAHIRFLCKCEAPGWAKP